MMCLLVRCLQLEQLEAQLQPTLASLTPQLVSRAFKKIVLFHPAWHLSYGKPSLDTELSASFSTKDNARSLLYLVYDPFSLSPICMLRTARQ